MWFCETPSGVILNIRAAPRSSRAGIDGFWGEDALRVKIRAAPVEGKANKEMIETLAEAFKVPKSAVSFVGGEASRTKRVLVKGVDAAAAMRLAGGAR